MRILIIVFLLVLWQSANLSASNVLFEYENKTNGGHNPAENLVKVAVIHFFDDEFSEEAVGCYSYTEVGKPMSRAHGGLIYRSTFGLSSNIGLGMSQDNYGFCGNLGISYRSTKHEADLQADVDSKLVLRGFYDFNMHDKVKVGIYGRTHYGLGPRVTFYPTKTLSIAWACAYDWSKPSDHAIASILQLQVHL